VVGFGKKSDMVTLEIEHVNADALIHLRESGIKVIPDPEMLKLIQDKGLQKTRFREAGIDTSDFMLAGSEEEVRNIINDGRWKFPFVQKTRKFGFDGRGVKIINSEADMDHLLKGPSVLERKEKIHKEISVIVARSTRGELKTFPVVEMIFNEDANLVDFLVCPAQIDLSVAEKARDLAVETAKAFDIQGLLAVEIFITDDHKLLVNEVAPRPHNSGHHTIEGNYTSQYEQHLRAIFGFPLGSVEIKIPSVMVNLLGEAGHKGLVKYEGLTNCMAIEGVKIHIYGKKETRPMRKMGHATILDHDINRAWDKARQIKNNLKILSWENQLSV
jgi:5-(carboxyamino)imidazole ribonucleotide synthase